MRFPFVIYFYKTLIKMNPDSKKNMQFFIQLRKIHLIAFIYIYSNQYICIFQLIHNLLQIRYYLLISSPSIFPHSFLIMDFFGAMDCNLYF